MKYRTLIFMAKHRMAAIDIGANDKADVISIDGNNVMEYTSGTQIREFCQYIKSYYNIDSFSDLEMEISILRFDAVMRDALLLLEEIQDAKEYNLISVEKVLPWIAVKEGLIKTGTVVQIETFDLTYTISLDEAMVMKCQAGGTDKEHVFILPKEKFTEYNHLDNNDLFGYEDEKKVLCEKYDNELKNKERRIRKLEQQLIKEKEKTKNIENRLEKAVSEIYEKEKSINRHICKFVNTDEINMTMVPQILQSAFRNITYTYTYIVKFCCYDADIVKRGQKIADIKVSLGGSRLPERDFFISAKEAGRIYWLCEPGAEVKSETNMAIIGDLSDTKEDVMKWYNKVQQDQ